MSLYKRSDSAAWWINVQWKGYDRIHLSTGTERKRLARDMLNTLRTLKAAGRRDLLGLIASRRLELADVHAVYLNDPGSVAGLKVVEPSPRLGALVGEWQGWLESPAGLSPRTRRRYRSQTIRRYLVSWERIFAQLPKGRDTTLAELTSGAIAVYRKDRVTAGSTGQTVNRDLCAIQSLLSWCEKEKEMDLQRPRLSKEKESPGRERWLTAEEIEMVRCVTSKEWWPLFATLIYAGLRIGEAQALRWSDVQLGPRQIAVHDRFHDLKTDSSDRDVPIPDPLGEALSAHAHQHPSGPADPVFPGRLGMYATARQAWRATCKRAGITSCRLHDLRHTFGVHAARSGVPLARLQRLMGHSSPITTMRYMRHAPNSDFAADAARIAGSMAVTKDAERQALPAVAKPRLVLG
jgi:integrase